MSRSQKELIIADRYRLQNPYAHLEELETCQAKAVASETIRTGDEQGFIRRVSVHKTLTPMMMERAGSLRLRRVAQAKLEAVEILELPLAPRHRYSAMACRLRLGTMTRAVSSD